MGDKEEKEIDEELRLLESKIVAMTNEKAMLLARKSVIQQKKQEEDKERLKNLEMMAKGLKKNNPLRYIKG